MKDFCDYCGKEVNSRGGPECQCPQQFTELVETALINLIDSRVVVLREDAEVRGILQTHPILADDPTDRIWTVRNLNNDYLSFRSGQVSGVGLNKDRIIIRIGG